MCESMEMSVIARQAAQAVTELLEQANLQPGQILVVGCSSSEIVGGHIGKNSSMQAAAAVYSAIAPIVKQKKLYLAAQCCEHLNRAIILEAEAAEKYGYEPYPCARGPMRAAAGPPPAGRILQPPWRWRKFRRTPGWTSAAR